MGMYHKDVIPASLVVTDIPHVAQIVKHSQVEYLKIWIGSDLHVGEYAFLDVIREFPEFIHERTMWFEMVKRKLGYTK